MRFRRWKALADVSRAIPALLALSVGALWACGARDVSAPQVVDVPGGAVIIDGSDEASATMIEPEALKIATYDLSGEAVHPDVLVFPRPWHGRRYWYAATPYPKGDSNFENPSIYEGSWSRDWRVPTGVSNPLARPEPTGYLSDPDLVYEPAQDELRLYYRESVRMMDRIHMMRSSNGTQWSAPVLVLQGPLASIVSPSIVREADGSWRMWAVDAGPDGCQARASRARVVERHSRDGVTWDDGSVSAMELAGWVPWHLDVQYVEAKHEYWALVTAYPDGVMCGASAVFLATSADGSAWKVHPSPLLGRFSVQELNDVVYRSTFRYHQPTDAVTVWFSGARYDGSNFHWTIATARYPVANLMSRVDAPAQRALAHGVGAIASVFADSAVRNRFAREAP